MKRLLFLFISVFSSCFADYAIVFVHLGTTLPSHQRYAFDQARLFNPTCPIYLIANASALENFSHDTITPIACESLVKSGPHASFLRESKTSGFWSYVVERFFYLEEAMSQYRLEHVFHLENDVMLYRNLNDLLPVFQAHYSKMIGGTFDNDDRCIPGFIYIDSLKPLSEFVSFVASRANLGDNDMALLGQFRTQYYKKFIDHLPIIPPTYEKSYSLETYTGKKAKFSPDYSNHFSKFASIFDAAAIGQYLGGQDPIHRDSHPGFINESCIFNPAYFTFSWEKDSQERFVPFMIFQGEKYQINNLHIHCKNLSAFSSLNPENKETTFAPTPLSKISYSLSSEQIDVVIYATEKHLPTLDLCIENLRNYGENIGRIFVISSKPLSEKGEWIDESIFPFSKDSLLNEIFFDNIIDRRRYAYQPRSQLQQLYGELIKLYAPLVIPNISSNVLLVDPQAIFLNHVDFMTKEGEPKFHVRGKFIEAYNAFAVRLLPSIFYGKYQEISHFILMQKTILNDLFFKVQSMYPGEVWKTICHKVDYSKIYEPCFSAFTLYGTFALIQTDQARLFPLKWSQSAHLYNLSKFQSEGYVYIWLDALGGIAH